MGKDQTNTVLNTRIYQVEFAGGRVIELTANILAELMYSPFDADRHEYLFLDAHFDYCMADKATSLSVQQTTVYGRSVTHETFTGWQICCQ